MDNSGQLCKVFEQSFHLLDSNYLEYMKTRLPCCHRDKSCLRGTVPEWPCRLTDKSCRAGTAQEKSNRCLDNTRLEYKQLEQPGPDESKTFPTGKVNTHSR